MEVRFRQTSIGWCVVYTWANLLNECGILKFCDEERFKGCGPDEEDEILQAFHPTIKMQTIAGVDQTYDLPLPLNYVWDLIQRDDELTFCENQVIPYCLTVRLIESMFHHVAIVKHGSGFYYCDPWRKNWMKITSLHEFSNLFKDVWTVQRPVLRNEPKFISFNADIFKYPFLEPEIA